MPRIPSLQQRQIAAFGALSLSLIGTVAAFFTVTTQRDHLRDTRDVQDESRMVAYRAIEQLKDEQGRLAAIQKETVTLTAALSEAERNGKVIKYSEGLSPRDRQALDQLRDGQVLLGQRLTALEGAIMQSPEKAVGIPMLKQQLADVQDRMHGDVDSIHGEISRLYGIMQWLLGLMFTLILGIAGLVFNALKTTDKPRQSGSNPEAAK